MEACPLESTKRSRLGQMGSSGSNRSRRCHRQYATGASAIGVPGWPELACCTASMDNVRMVLMLSWSMLAFMEVRAAPKYKPTTKGPLSESGRKDFQDVLTRRRVAPGAEKAQWALHCAFSGPTIELMA